MQVLTVVAGAGLVTGWSTCVWKRLIAEAYQGFAGAQTGILGGHTSTPNTLQQEVDVAIVSHQRSRKHFTFWLSDRQLLINLTCSSNMPSGLCISGLWASSSYQFCSSFGGSFEV